jgi:hypothetical protein
MKVITALEASELSQIDAGTVGRHADSALEKIYAKIREAAAAKNTEIVFELEPFVASYSDVSSRTRQATCLKVLEKLYSLGFSTEFLGRGLRIEWPE